jgi:DNA polymerase V
LAQVMSVLEEFAPQMEVYSIDKTFLDLNGVCRQDLVANSKRNAVDFLHIGLGICTNYNSEQSKKQL